MRWKKQIEKGGSAYDLSSHHWICPRCGGRKPPDGPYAGLNPMVKYCRCNKIK